ALAKQQKSPGEATEKPCRSRVFFRIITLSIPLCKNYYFCYRNYYALALGEKTHYSIRVKGRVQGVGYRYSAVREARKHDIKGFVKNLPDGSVAIEAEGLQEQLDTFLLWCRKGPGTGYVESVDFYQLPPAGFKEFRIEY
ncbi:MAG: acylphosphatase, partial [Bacteroidota bacterium]